ncbi:MAG: hypothetical protein ACK4I8_06285 [Armatimonadota bacterium]
MFQLWLRSDEAKNCQAVNALQFLLPLWEERSSAMRFFTSFALLLDFSFWQFFAGALPDAPMSTSTVGGGFSPELVSLLFVAYSSRLKSLPQKFVSLEVRAPARPKKFRLTGGLGSCRAVISAIRQVGNRQVGKSAGREFGGKFFGSQGCSPSRTKTVVAYKRRRYIVLEFKRLRPSSHDAPRPD